MYEDCQPRTKNRHVCNQQEKQDLVQSPTESAFLVVPSPREIVGHLLTSDALITLCYV